MNKYIIAITLIVTSLFSANASQNATNMHSGEIKAQFQNSGYKKVVVDSIAAGAQLVCSFTTGDISASHTVELGIRAKKADGRYTKWKNTAYNPNVNYDYTVTSGMTEAVDKNILRAQKADGIYYKSHDAERDDKTPERTVTLDIPTFDDEATDIINYEIKIKYTNDCQTSGTCHWTIR